MALAWVKNFKVPESKNADGLFGFFEEQNFLLNFQVPGWSAVDFSLMPTFPYGQKESLKFSFETLEGARETCRGSKDGRRKNVEF